jgi:hypothetical protein
LLRKEGEMDESAGFGRDGFLQGNELAQLKEKPNCGLKSISKPWSDNVCS